MSNNIKNNNESIDFLKIFEQIESKFQKQIDSLIKKQEYLLRKEESQEKEIYNLKKELYNLREERENKEVTIKTLEEKIRELEKEEKVIYKIASRSFRFCKALAYSTGRFSANSIFMEEPAEQIEYIKEFELKDPEKYPIGTYKARNGRLRNIVELIKEKGEITTREIVNKFNICHHTARADMRDLLDAFPNALKLFIPKQKGKESYKLIEVSKLAWGLPSESL